MVEQATLSVPSEIQQKFLQDRALMIYNRITEASGVDSRKNRIHLVRIVSNTSDYDRAIVRNPEGGRGRHISIWPHPAEDMKRLFDDIFTEEELDRGLISVSLGYRREALWFVQTGEGEYYGTYLVD